MRRSLVGLALGLAACEGAGHVDPCQTAQAPILGCPPPAVQAAVPTIEEACSRLVDCGVLPLDDPNDDGNHWRDYTACVNRLRGDEFPADRLAFTLRCIEVSTCLDLRDGLGSPCFVFGGEPPQ